MDEDILDLIDFDFENREFEEEVFLEFSYNLGLNDMEDFEF